MIKESFGRRLEYAIRTIYPCTVCLLLSLLFRWGGDITFLSYVVSVVAASRHFGKWQLNAWGISYSCLIGAALGTIIGLTTANSAVLAVCLFVGIMWVDRCSAFDALSRVLTLVCVILGALFPSLSNNEVTGVKSFVTLLMIMYIPFAVIGFTLLFPFPSLAADVAKKSMGNLCKNLNRVVQTQTKAYCNNELMEFYLSDAENIIDEFLLPELESMEELIPFIEYEAVVFNSLIHLAPSLRHFISTSRSILIHANLQRNLIRKSVGNTTHAVFLYHLEPALHDISADIKRALTVASRHIESNNRTYVDEYYETFGFISSLVLQSLCELLQASGSGRGGWSSIRHYALGVWAASTAVPWPWRGHSEVDAFAFSHRRHAPARLSRSSADDVVYTAVGRDVAIGAPENRDEDGDLESGIELGLGLGLGRTDDNIGGGTHEFDDLIACMEVKKANLLYGYHCLRQVFIYREYHRWAHFHESFSVGVVSEHDRCCRSHQVFINADSVLNSHSPLEDLEVLGSRVAHDNSSLGLLNLGPRAAFLFRTTGIMENVYELKHMLEAEREQTDNPCRGVQFDSSALAARMAFYLLSYVQDAMASCQEVLCGLFDDCVRLMWAICCYSCSGIDTITTDNRTPQGNEPPCSYRKLVLLEMSVLLEPAKLAVAITSCSLFVILAPLNSQVYARNSSLAAFTIALVRRANSASSFLTGSQRMLGTVLGAVFSFTLYQGLGCEKPAGYDYVCGPSVTIPVLMMWLCFCACFREGPQYGYAAVVAGFTPLVLFFQSSEPTESGAWLRVEMTILGILVYLLIDNIVMPVRADEGLKLSLLGCLNDSRCALSTVVTCLKLVAGVPNQGADVAIEKSIVKASDSVSNIRVVLPMPTTTGGTVSGSATTSGDVAATATDDRVDMLLLHRTRSRSARKLSIVSEDSTSGGGAPPPPSDSSPRSVRCEGDEMPDRTQEAPSEDHSKPTSFWANIWTCEDTVDDIRVHLDGLRSKLCSAKALLSLAPIEPHFFKAEFQTKIYSTAVHCFRNLHRSGTAVVRSVTAICNVITRLHSQDVITCLEVVGYIIRKAILVSECGERVLLLAHAILSRLYGVKDAEGEHDSLAIANSDMTEVLVLSKLLRESKLKINDYYSKILLNRNDISSLNPQFLVAQHNLTESMSVWIEDLSKLGIALRNVRDVEMHV